MGTYGLDGVIKAWRLDKLTSEQAIGQILLLLKEFEDRLTLVESKVWKKPAASEGTPKSSEDSA
ncbi:MAG: hypothetical protein ACT4QE_13420 [Anaerolineales bacterium]